MQTDIIFTETVLIPDHMAEKALWDNGIADSDPLFLSYIEKLCNRLDYHYCINDRFRKQILGNECREIAYMYFDHWIKGGYLKSNQVHVVKAKEN